MTDPFVFPLFQAAILGACLYGMYRERKALRKKPAPVSVSGAVTRGDESFKRFGVAYGFLSVLVLQVNNSALSNVTWLVGNSTVVNVFDLIALVYLCFYNSWFRNLVIGLYGSAREKKERI